MGTAETDMALQSQQQQQQQQHIQHTRPEFRTPLTNLTAHIGQKIELECTLIGEPRPTVLWKMNGKPLLVSERVKVSQCECKCIIHMK